MSINVMGTAGYVAGYQTGKTKRNAVSGTKTFMEIAVEKSAQDKVTAYGEKAAELAGASAAQSAKGHNPSRVLDSLAKHAPEEVRQAFLEAEKETGGTITVFGLWISNDGKQSHMTQMGIERFVRWYNGESNQSDLLGTSVGSAISAVKKWIYALDHPLAGQPAKSAEERKLVAMERAFYESFLEKLKKL